MRALAWIREHRSWLLAGGLSLAVVLLAAGSFALGFSTAPSAAVEPTATTPSTPKPTVRPTPVEAATAAPLRTCSVATAASDPRLDSFEGRVVDVASGSVLFDRSGSTAKQPGSLVKILVAAAALGVLGPDYRIPTDVVDTGDGGVALVGHGDPTLSRTPAGTQSWYQDAPKLSVLAAQTLTAWASAHPGEQLTSVELDDSYWNDSDDWDPSWPATERTDGWQPLVTALMVDGDRDDPTVDQSPRSTDPVGRAGTAFVAALHAADTTGIVSADVTVTRGAAPSSAVQLAEVQSQPVSTLIGQMFLHSDNALGEMLARIVSVQAGGGGTAASLNAVILKALSAYAVPTDGIHLVDGSGESDDDQVPPSYLTAFLALAKQGGQHLDVIRDALPVAGQPGSLESRFTGANAVARGRVMAKTGWLADAYTLAGYIDARDGTTLAFAFYAIGDGIGTTPDGTTALDTLATAVYRCGGNLAND